MMQRVEVRQLEDWVVLEVGEGSRNRDGGGCESVARSQRRTNSAGRLQRFSTGRTMYGHALQTTVLELELDKNLPDQLRVAS